MRNESLAPLGTARDHLEGVETNSLGQRAALADDNLVAFVASEARGDVRGDVRVTLFVTLVLLNEVQVIHAHNDGAVHLRRLDNAGQNATSDGHVTRERALLVDVGACKVRKKSRSVCLSHFHTRHLPRKRPPCARAAPRRFRSGESKP